MTSYVLEKVFRTDVELSPNVLAVANMFGLGTDRNRELKVIDNCQMNIEAGQVVYITGDSGAGKSLMLKLLKEKLTGAVDLDDVSVSTDKPLVDCFSGELEDSLYWLSLAGLSDAFAILRRPGELSDGQRYRFRLALALSHKPAVICIDEFCATLDRITAAVVSHNVRKFADKFSTTFVVATSHDDMLEDLRPDVVVVKHLGSGSSVYYPGKMEVGSL